VNYILHDNHSPGPAILTNPLQILALPLVVGILVVLVDIIIPGFKVRHPWRSS